MHPVSPLQSKSNKRKEDLEDSLEAQQYFADANEAEAWMREKDPLVTSSDYGKDEDSAEVRINKQTRKQTNKFSCRITLVSKVEAIM